MTKINPAANAETVVTARTAAAAQETETKAPLPLVKGEVPKEENAQDYNLYGKDFANFSKFKGNDKHDAMRMTNTAATDVKKAYMQLQHEFPDINLVFDAMPDPQKCGKGREGFFTYQQQLEEWKDFALEKINNQRELTTKEQVQQDGDKTRAVVAGVGAAVISNDDLNTAIVLENQDENAEEVQRTAQNEGAKTRAAVKKEAEDTQEAVHVEGAVTRGTVLIDGAVTRAANHIEHAETRKEIRRNAAETEEVVRQEGRKTRVNDDINTEIIYEEVAEEGKKTRKKVDEAIEIDDPLGTKRAIHKAKKRFGKH